jgi:hypothetical protein
MHVVVLLAAYVWQEDWCVWQHQDVTDRNPL